ncbi:MAG: hypothetical protein JST12_02465 [Armatimonadetes bacterium]|nr:hypothetical protein [Armatimonadota bacterium]MBS1700497.1 hypothetical protein [Armatimonadota bacterium]MBS1725240.1 hypothetical protein [Armatimonadota bacterium]
MKRIFLFNETVVPITDFDIRVTIVALQAVRGLIIERCGWPDHLDLDQKMLSRFLDLPIVPTFLGPDDDFVPFENRYQSRLKELTGFPSHSKDFHSRGKTFRDFAEHRLGTTLEGALFHMFLDAHRTGRATIPSLSGSEDIQDRLQRPITKIDLAGLTKVMEVVLNPLLETGHAIVQMNPHIEKEFPRIASIIDHSSIGRRFGDVVSDAIYPLPTRDRAPA